MKLVEPRFIIETPINGVVWLKEIERIGRLCYKSEGKITEDSYLKFVKMLMTRRPLPHESVIEHKYITVRFIANRGFTHELVRHRIASYSQESTVYIDYAESLSFITPIGFTKFDPKALLVWEKAMNQAEENYKELRSLGLPPKLARSVLPNSQKTEIVITANLRSWRNIFKQRTAASAHPDMQFLMRQLLDKFKILLPVIFDDITY